MAYLLTLLSPSTTPCDACGDFIIWMDLRAQIRNGAKPCGNLCKRCLDVCYRADLFEKNTLRTRNVPIVLGSREEEEGVLRFFEKAYPQFAVSLGKDFSKIIFKKHPMTKSALKN